MGALPGRPLRSERFRGGGRSLRTSRSRVTGSGTCLRRAWGTGGRRHTDRGRRAGRTAPRRSAGERDSLRPSRPCFRGPGAERLPRSGVTTGGGLLCAFPPPMSPPSCRTSATCSRAEPGNDSQHAELFLRGWPDLAYGHLASRLLAWARSPGHSCFGWGMSRLRSCVSLCLLTGIRRFSSGASASGRPEKDVGRGVDRKEGENGGQSVC